jgi:hypothetical protein
MYASVAAELEKQQPGRHVMSFTFPRSAATEAYICNYGSLLRSRSV